MSERLSEVDIPATRLVDDFDSAGGLEEAYDTCRRINEGHYENFTVVSRLLPRDKHKYVHAFYAYCRFTDDLGDELKGNRMAALDRWEEAVRDSLDFSSNPSHPILLALQDTVRKLDLPRDQFYKLIEANRMDQNNHRYQTYEDLLEYCNHSANPVGRIFLNIFGYGTDRQYRLSDKTCTGLQLTNFWQDVSRDEKKGRIYIPLEDMDRFNYGEEDLTNQVYDERFVKLLKFEVERARGLLEEGLGLVEFLEGRLKVDVTLFNKGGLAILDKIQALDYDVLHHRPTLSKVEKMELFLSTLIKTGLGALV